MIQAKRKDGSPVQAGDFVIVVWDNGRKISGRVATIGNAMKLASANYACLQTYTIRGRDGMVRPAHAWHIKFAKAKGVPVVGLTLGASDIPY